MQYEIKSAEEGAKYISCLKNKVQQFAAGEVVNYVRLGSKVIRIFVRSQEFLPLMQKQLTYTLSDEADKFDATLVVWKEENPQSYIDEMAKGNVPLQMRMRLDKLMSKQNAVRLDLMDENYSHFYPVISIDAVRGFISAYDERENTYYYGVKDLSPEEFIKEGHIFVQFFNKVARTDNSNLVHGAVVGMDNNGVLFCARGQRGKSTLTVLSMIRGFEYVSDDYLILETEANKLYSYPIYSIITLSPRMYNELYDDLKGKFVSNNARKDKYVINIEGYHNQFKNKYPIELCIFPEIVSDKEPSIVPCSAEDKGRAMVQFIQSTVSQVQDINRQDVVRKIFNMIKDKEFYKFNLCNDIEKNTAFLREFLQKWHADSSKVVKPSEIMLDITFDLANIIDTKTFIIYSMNKFATNLLENLMNGVSKEEIRAELQKFEEQAPDLCADFDNFVQVVQKYGFVKMREDKTPLDINWNFAEENNYKISIWEYIQNKTTDLIKQK